jgi:hypothetical protein
MGVSGGVGRADPDVEWLTPFAQARVDDEVIAAALFRPNGPGRWACSSLDAFGQRQILKAQGRHHGDRLVVALTAWQIHALALTMTGRVAEHLVWNRATALVLEVPLRPGVSSPGTALFIGSPSRQQAVEVVECGDGSMSATLLVGRLARSGARP